MKISIKFLLFPLLFLTLSHCAKDKLTTEECEPASIGSGEEIFQVVENMPAFPGCENTGDKTAYQACSTEKLLEFIYENVEYPKIAKDNGIEGTVVIRFVVDRNGNVVEPEIVREIGGGCEEEALRVVKIMPVWHPGTQRGVPVNVYFNLPVKFKL